ncbi:hypothetical protein PFICI_09016 [Pestalotiopsis fici W106-1]|uniref:Mid2 domain-containing protein n=1 Tax=Pestalotiopsis fici (strain W106-1 / CGMCC3.15140) TaxID=1229662 RepID=W3WZ74_PESFW|nr:uncharacterized protein PFICI_09016 [Pestalotiopsis fici W106-1]ETS79163.1 hypothetical protein PFICI_09016 [Pestalotiopsis fici W106-1]
MSSTTAVSTTATVTAATVQALTTEFKAPTTCYSMQLTQLSSPGWEIWLNEPQPVPGTVYPDCYPTEFIDGYTSIANASSSIAPMMSPLVAPENWVTAYEQDNGYIALCPSGFLIHMIDDPIDTNRPAYGATCYSDFTAGHTVTVSGYDTQGFTGTNLFNPKSTDQAFAHVIEGKKLTSSITAAATTTTSDSTTSTAQTSGASATSTSSSDSSSSSSSVSGGTIAGAVIGSIAGVALIAAALFFLLRRRKGPAASAPEAGGQGHSAVEMGESSTAQGSPYQENYAFKNAAIKDYSTAPSHASAISPTSPYGQMHYGQAMSDGNYAELPAHNLSELETPPGPTSASRELDTGYMGSELHSNHQNHPPSSPH